MKKPGWAPVARLTASYRDDGQAQPVGELAKARVIAFQYNADWLERGIELSPEHLPIAVGREVQLPANGARMHGLFMDALPDAWGDRIMRMAFERHGVRWSKVSELDRLAALGSRAIGALSLAPASELHEASDEGGSVEGLLATVDELLGGDPTHIPVADLERLERAGGTPGGAQPKVLIGIRESDDAIIAKPEPPNGFTPYLLKFSPRREGMDLSPATGRIESAFFRMAREAGLTVPNTRLLQISGRAHFAIARFDRTPAGGRRHVHSMAGLLGRKASDDYDYDELLRIALHLTGDERAIREAFARCLFNVLAGNDDDHGRNTSFLLEPSRGWTLSPAYDLVFQSGRGSRGMTVLGKEADIRQADVVRLAEKHGIPAAAAKEMLDRVLEAVAKWRDFASNDGVPDESQAEIEAVMKERRAVMLS